MDLSIGGSEKMSEKALKKERDGNGCVYLTVNSTWTINNFSVSAFV